MKTIITALFLLILISINTKAQTKSDVLTILKSVKIGKSNQLIKFVYNDSSKKEYVVSKTNKTTLVIKENKTKKVVETFLQKIPPVGGDEVYDCAEQEKEQYEVFKNTVLPQLLRIANRQCRMIRYCLIYYCDGQPTLAVMYLIKPSRRCYTIKQMETEINKYQFK
jgi:hypothetical protein